jgi:hypothetical protein
MSKKSLMQQALGKQWDELPPSLQAHYKNRENIDIGKLDIEYPRFMQPYLSFLRLLGALVNQRGKKLPTTVEKWMDNDIQQWKRSIQFPDGKTIFFKSHWDYIGANELIEYVNGFIGLRMRVEVKEQQLHYHGVSYVIKLGHFLLPIPEWVILGHTTIVETALNENEFAMDFRLRHPLFGQLFRYTGTFHTK